MSAFHLTLLYIFRALKILTYARSPHLLRYLSAAGVESGDLGLTQIVDSLRFFLRPGGTSANLVEDLAKAVNQVQTLKDLLKSGRGLLAAAGASIPEYER